MSHFNKVANEWDKEEKVLMMKDLANKTKKVLNLNEKSKILDFGCGTGLFGLEFINHAKELVGIDTSEEMLKVWDKKTAGRNSISRKLINLEKEDITKKFDLIISSMAFHHLEKPNDLLLKLSQLLLPGGKIAIIDLEKEDGTFHPDNTNMGVKHFGFENALIQSWADKAKLNVEIHRINEIQKNNKGYFQFLAVFSK